MQPETSINRSNTARNSCWNFNRAVIGATLDLTLGAGNLAFLQRTTGRQIVSWIGIIKSGDGKKFNEDECAWVKSLIILWRAVVACCGVVDFFR